MSAGPVGLTQFGGTPGGSKAWSEVPSRTAIALIGWFPDARDRGPSLAEPSLALEPRFSTTFAGVA